MPYHLFDTAFGTCGLAWSETGLTRVQLPESTRSATESRVRRAGLEPSSESEIPGFADEALTALKAYFAGTDVSFETLRLDETSVTGFNASVYRALRNVPRGTTVTYGDLAELVGQPGAAQAVGVAMGRNPWPVIVPCHRVLASGGKVGGFSAPGGVSTKEKLLALEGVRVGSQIQPSLF